MKMLAGWEWGRMHAPSGTLLFARVFGTEHSLFQTFYWLDGRTQLPHLHIGVGQRLNVEDVGHSRRLWGNDGGLCLDLALTRTERLVQRSSNHAYGRFLSHGEGVVETNDGSRPLSGPVIHEVQRFETAR
jgi:hypothetical protein